MAMVRMILMVTAIVRTVFTSSCTSCDKTACVEPLNCKAGLMKGLCGCCDVCAKLENERCGGPWYIHGKCAEGLKCVTRTQLDRRDQFLPEYFRIGVCEPDACQNKTCGFRQKCKVNRRGYPVCICPRRCGKAKNPVCGLLNGKQYRNKCKLRREECLTKTEIGLITGKCKRCTHSGKEFKYGDSRPDTKPCETCICQHGLWKCDIEPSCFLNNLPIRSDHPSCLVTQDGKSQVLPCPRGLSCRVPKSDDIHDSYRVGVCKPKKVKKPKKVSRLVQIQETRNNIFESDSEERLREGTSAERRMPAESEYREIPVFTEMKTTSGTTRSTSAPAVQLRNDHQLNGGLMTHVCLAYPDKRSCSSVTSIRWYYNATTRSCVQFSYGECGGNFNNFLSIETCQEVCQSGSHPTALPSTPTKPSPMYVTTQRRGHHEIGMLFDMCHDMKSGMSYRNREKWDVDACTSCSCINGRALCVAATCPITCLNPVYIEGKCCPTCKADVDDGIIVEGKETRCKDTETELWYHSGESWSKDNCTKCVCFEGEMSCMASICSKPLCSNPVKKEGVCCPVCPKAHSPAFEPTMEMNDECRDESTGKLYLPGEGWNINDCVSCFCGEGGQQVCHQTNCSVSQCENPVHLQGRCCPVCPEAFHSACIYDNRQYFQGDFMLLRDMCTLCKCNGNMWNCTVKYCSKQTAKDILDFPFKLKPTAPYSQGTTSNSEFYIKSQMTENIPTDGDSEKREDYIIEDPFRMTRRDMKSSNSDDGNEINKVLAFMVRNRLKTTLPMSTDSQSPQKKDQISNEDSSLNLEPTKTEAEETLPWFRNFNHKLWSTWDEPEYSDRVPDEKNSTGIYGKKGSS